jgi:hypothetical protein
LILLTVILATLVALALGRGDPLIAAAPVLVTACAYAIPRVRARTLALGLILAVLCLESPHDRPADGMWESPLLSVGRFLFESLGGTLGLGIPASPFELVVFGWVQVLLWRRRRRPGAAGVNATIALQAATIFALLAFGLLRGGDVQAAYWQVRQLLAMPALAFIFHELLTGDRAELKALGWIVVGSAVFKAVQGAWFYTVIAAPQGLTPAYVTTHADTVLFVAAVLILICYHLHARTARSLWTSLGLGAVILCGVYLNDRRIAWVELVLGIVALWALMTPGPVKRRALKLGCALSPLIAIYVAVGWGSPAQVFRPLHALGSVEEAGDSSTFAREVENYNLAMTVRESPLWGHGFGHHYREVVRNEIHHSFELFRYIPHNNIYALYLAGGALGFFGVWFPLVYAVFLAARALRASRDPLVRTAALGVVGAVFLFALQAWGDMGTQSYSPVLFAALALGGAARIAVSLGAWPQARPAELRSLVASPVGHRT